MANQDAGTAIFFSLCESLGLSGSIEYVQDINQYFMIDQSRCSAYNSFNIHIFLILKKLIYHIFF